MLFYCISGTFSPNSHIHAVDDTIVFMVRFMLSQLLSALDHPTDLPSMSFTGAFLLHIFSTFLLHIWYFTWLKHWC